MANYFSQMGTAWINYQDGTTRLTNDITKFVTFKNLWKNDPRVQLQYQIKDGDMTHTISNNLYGTVDHWWTVQLFNDIWNFDDQWPRSYDGLNKYIAKKYPLNDPGDVHHYVAANGTVVDLLAVKIKYNVSADRDAIYVANLTPVTIYDYEQAVNEQKRNIILIDPDYIDVVVTQYESLMKT